MMAIFDDSSYFIAYVVNIVEPFLTKYQTCKAMIQMVTKLLEIIIKPEIFEKCKSWNKILKIELSLMITFSLMEKSMLDLLSQKN